MNLKICPDCKPNPNPKPIHNPNPFLSFPIPNPMPLTYDFSYDNQITPEKNFAVTSSLLSHLSQLNTDF